MEASQLERKVCETNGYVYTPYDGITYPPFMCPPKIDELRASFEVEADGVVIATFPKAGTTWMQQIVLLLCNGGDAAQIPNPMKMSPWLECVVSTKALGLSGNALSIEELRAYPKGRPWKTHAPAHLRPWKVNAGKTIVVARNPFDTAVSMFHHTCDIPDFAFTGSWDVFAKFFLDGTVESGSFWDWYGGWWNLFQEDLAAGSNKILWVTYEALQADLAAEVTRIATFIGVEPTAELVAKVVAGSKFDHMKAQFAAHDAKVLAEGGKPKKDHIRQGKVGAWGSYFTAEQKAAFDAKTKALKASCHPGLEFAAA